MHVHTAGGSRGGDLTVFSHTLVSADLSCSYLHQASGGRKWQTGRKKQRCQGAELLKTKKTKKFQVRGNFKTIKKEFFLPNIIKLNKINKMANFLLNTKSLLD